MIFKKAEHRNPWTWIPTLYIAEGIPYVVVMSVSVVMYKKLGISNADITLYTSWLYLPWVIKPLWSPIVDIFLKKRVWIIITQLIASVGLAGVAFTIPVSNFFQYTLAFFWLLAFNSATHDIAADGFYMLGLSQHDQAWFVGIRSTFYKFAFIIGQGPLIVLAGILESGSKGIPYAWMISFFILTALFALFLVYHLFILPHPVNDKSVIEKVSISSILSEFFKTFVVFFQKKNVGLILAFILLYRLGESQLTKIAPLFFLDPVSKGGIGLSTEQLGILYETIGPLALLIGGILGGILSSKHGLKFWLFPMLIAINVPDLVYVFLAFTQTQNMLIISIMIFIEQFGYGFGFTAFMLYLIYIAEGDRKTSHYAIATGFMAFGMMIPGMFSGWFQELIGYKDFFIWVCLATIPIFIIAKFIPLDSEFGKKQE
jgi:MFS transporter, PAT family, beta-lactamase induction signal transducer AmpG